ncbi:MAG: hypothetical protein AB8H80_02760 [Planctomycetota bacterium]
MNALANALQPRGLKSFALAVVTATLAVETAPAQLPDGSILVATSSFATPFVDGLTTISAGVSAPLTGAIDFGLSQSALAMLPGSGFPILAVQRAGGINIEQLVIVNTGGVFSVAGQANLLTLPNTVGATPVDMTREEGGSHLLLLNGGRLIRFAFGPTGSTYSRELMTPGLPYSSVDVRADGAILLTDPLPGPFGGASNFYTIPYDGAAAPTLSTTVAAGAGQVTQNQFGETLVAPVSTFGGVNLSCDLATFSFLLPSPVFGLQPANLASMHYVGKGFDTLLCSGIAILGSSSVLQLPGNCAALATASNVPTPLFTTTTSTIVHIIQSERLAFGEYGHSGVSTNGLPLQLTNANQALIGTNYILEIDGALPNTPLTLMWATGIDAVDLSILGAPENFLYVSNILSNLPLTSDASGEASLTVPIANDPTLIGTRFTWQAATTNGANNLGLALSNAVITPIR